MGVLTSLPFILVVVGQATPPAPEATNEAPARLERMKASAMAYELRPGEGGSVAYRLRADPIFRFTNPVGNSKDGAVFLWLGEDDRPAAAVQVFERRDGLWFHELTTLSEGPVVGSSPGYSDWTPTEGIESRPIPGAPRPAETAEQRLRQMQALVRDFAAEDEFQRKSWQKLRVLSKPLARFGKSGADPIDGALFGYVLTTDPEVLLMIEARAGAGGSEWRYAFAPMSTYALRGLYQGQEVWSIPHRPSGVARDATKPFHVREIRPEE
jgi:hypothetical protein